jgi:anti-sigma regulatory factor (Ser/Thr protein kinase)
MSLDKGTIRQCVLELIAADGLGVARRLGQKFGVSRQVANGYLQAMVRDGLLETTGTTRSRNYSLKTLAEAEQTFPQEGLDEYNVWLEVVKPVVAVLPPNVSHIWQHAVTEMVNNAIDHSGSPEVQVRVRRNAFDTEVIVTDRGEGIFVKIQRALGLHDPRESVLELAKGKLTTAPSRHSGEGIFFTSRAVDLFEIESHHLRFTHESGVDDRIIEHAADVPGTTVRMRLRNDSPRVLREVFGEFTEGENGDRDFARTVVPLRLAQYEGDRLMSRSQAKRVVARFERFRRVEVDFAGIDEIGQAFADELFRVYARAHPQIVITAVNAEPAVAQMIRRVMTAAADPTDRAQ